MHELPKDPEAPEVKEAAQLEKSPKLVNVEPYQDGASGRGPTMFGKFKKAALHGVTFNIHEVVETELLAMLPYANVLHIHNYK